MASRGLACLKQKPVENATAFASLESLNPKPCAPRPLNARPLPLHSSEGQKAPCSRYLKHALKGLYGVIYLYIYIHRYIYIYIHIYGGYMGLDKGYMGVVSGYIGDT